MAVAASFHLVIGVGAAAYAVYAGWFETLPLWVAELVMRSVKASPEANALLADVERYRAQARTMEPKAAADGFVSMYVIFARGDIAAFVIVRTKDKADLDRAMKTARDQYSLLPA